MSSILTKPGFPGSTTALPGPHRPARGPWWRRATAWLLGRLENNLHHLGRRCAPPLNLEMTDRFVRFRGMKEFEFALVSRTEFPASRVRDLMTTSPTELEAASGRIRDAERLFASVLARSVNEPALTGELFRELELKLFSQDHGWREIMEGLMRLSPDYDEYKRIALVKYMQYLRARQTIMRSAFVEKTRDDENACLHATPAIEDTDRMVHGDTAIFDRPRSQPGELTLERGYRSLPKGESVQVDPGAGRHMDLLLAGNRVRLYTGRESYLVDDGDATYPLHPGKNLVGRNAACDVVLDPACRSISRIHLIVEPLSGGQVLLTDLSSHGTEIAAGLLKAA